ncbi:25080_t:CDS:2, partial [Gigaspora margarita]
MSNEQREPASDFDPQIIDNACQATITTLLRRMEEMINRKAETQRLWNEQIQKVLDEHFRKLEQATPVMICSQLVMRDELSQANFPSTPILNYMIIDL